MTIREELIASKIEGHNEFMSALVPNIPKDCVLGVKTPEMRLIAKNAYYLRSAECATFLKDLPHYYLEENLVHFFIISMIKDFDECVKAVEEFLPYVDCWPVSDQASPKVFRKHHDRLLPLVKKWIASDHVYTSRFGMRMLMNEFLDEDFKKEYLELVAEKTIADEQRTNDGHKGTNVVEDASNEYYLKMMQAWFFATALAKQYDASVKYIEEGRLDVWVHNKSIQKAIESFRVSDAHKVYLRTLKRK